MFHAVSLPLGLAALFFYIRILDMRKVGRWDFLSSDAFPPPHSTFSDEARPISPPLGYPSRQGGEIRFFRRNHI